MYTDRYSRMVAWLKVSLPLLALMILSNIFLVSRTVDPPAAVPFADEDVRERLTNQQVTGPVYTSMSAEGDEIELIAETVKTGPETGTHFATNVEVTVLFANGVETELVANEADIDIGADLTDLLGDVVGVTSRDEVLISNRLLVRMTSGEVTSPGAVIIITPDSTIEAGAMRLLTPENERGTQLFFTNGVKVLYRSQN